MALYPNPIDTHAGKRAVFPILKLRLSKVVRCLNGKYLNWYAHITAFLSPVFASGSLNWQKPSPILLPRINRAPYLNTAKASLRRIFPLCGLPKRLTGEIKIATKRRGNWAMLQGKPAFS